MKRILYIHGKGGRPDEAEAWQAACPGYVIEGVPYRGDTPWEVKGQLRAAYERAAAEGPVWLMANSIGAYFAMDALGGCPVRKAFFISPVVDMERLILDMMGWAGVTERELEEKGKIPTGFGETLSWDYLRYVRAHPVRWDVPTEILYAGRDHLVSRETVEAFAARCGGRLTVMEEGEHWFHTEEQIAFLTRWLRRAVG